MLQHFNADIVFPITDAPIPNGVVSLDDNGTIQFIGTYSEAIARGFEDIQRLAGALVPGFVNAHCHLELSHMRGLIPKHTGLVPFLQMVMNHRLATNQEVIEAATSADAAMYKNGIVAVGDISNNALTSSVKRDAKLYYHTFIEVLGIKEAFADQSLARSKDVSVAFEGLSHSLVPHAPYSVSDKLFELLKIESIGKSNIFSIHNQESEDENLLFLEGKGAFLEFYKSIGYHDPIHPKHQTSIHHYLKYLLHQPTLLVHNTFSNRQDVTFAKAQHPNLLWCVCPNANLYIEGQLPDIDLLHTEGLDIVIGTDSLASNDQLNIAAELMVLQANTTITLNELLKWATFNGARVLQVEECFGQLKVGMQPGLNLIKIDGDQNILSDKVLRLH